jgi:type I restriction-modification system DNA methylase subunit
MRSTTGSWWPRGRAAPTPGTPTSTARRASTGCRPKRDAHLKAQARQATVGQLVDDAMAGIERDNPALKSVLPKDYARPALDKERLGQLIDLVSNSIRTVSTPLCRESRDLYLR